MEIEYMYSISLFYYNFRYFIYTWVISDIDTEPKVKYIFLIIVYTRKEGHAFVEVLH